MGLRCARLHIFAQDPPVDQRVFDGHDVAEHIADGTHFLVLDRLSVELPVRDPFQRLHRLVHLPLDLRGFFDRFLGRSS
jgi:hypothetical protein